MSVLQKSLLTLFCATSLSAASCYAAEAMCTTNCHPLYFGVEGGYGSTTWYGLVPAINKQSIAMSMSTPIAVNEGGMVLGLFAGYEFTPFFAIEGNYVRYKTAAMSFGEDSIFFFDYGETRLVTETSSTSLMGKIMLIVPRTNIRAYSSFGVAATHRMDHIYDARRVSPTFGLGINYNLTNHFMAEIAGNYTAGFGESELQPVNDYIPFLYAVFLRIAYRI